MTRYRPPECCPPEVHPPLPDIAPGLSRLPRETALFGGWRAALLSSIGQPLMGSTAVSPLAGWTADSDGDLGVMILEFWAYVLDVLSFYDARIAERSYLGTASEARIAQEIVALIGHVPRPALAALVDLALEADGTVDPVAVPERSRFLSQAFGSEAPQAFETMAASTIWPQRNRWTFAPWRRPDFSAPLRLTSGESPSRGSILLLTKDSDPAFAGRVAATTTESASDGQRYQLVTFEDGSSPDVLAGADRSHVSVFVMGLTAGLSPFADAGERINESDPFSTSLVLDSVYPQIGQNSLAVVEAADNSGATRFYAVTITAISLFPKNLPTAVSTVEYTLNLSQISFAPPASLTGQTIRVHLVPKLLGQPTRPAEAVLTLADLKIDGSLRAPAPPLRDAPAGGSFVALGASAKGALLDGSIEEEGEARDFVPGADGAEFPRPLQTPVDLLGNVVSALRGETVPAETLGSGNAALAWQRFKLMKKPLTWIADAYAESGRSPQIDVFVDGIRWHFVETLYGRGGTERVFTIEMETDGTAWVCGGDGLTGSRFPTGNGNIRASYRFGAGAAKPPAGSIQQIIQPAPGLLRVATSMTPRGGADAETAAEMAFAAPTGALLLGRAVSADDFLAMARSFSGIINAAVSVGWDSGLLQPVIFVHFIADEGDPSNDLKTYLELRSLPGLAIKVTPATAIAVTNFDVSLKIDSDFDPAVVRGAVAAALFDPDRGILAPRNIAIGAPLFYSKLVEAIHEVPGVEAVTALSFDGEDMPYAKNPGQGAWFDILPVGRVI